MLIEKVMGAEQDSNPAEAYTIYTGNPALTITLKRILAAFANKTSGGYIEVKASLAQQKVWVTGISRSRLNGLIGSHLSAVDIERIELDENPGEDYKTDESELVTDLTKAYEDLANRLKELEEKSASYQPTLAAQANTITSLQEENSDLRIQLKRIHEYKPSGLIDVIYSFIKHESSAINEYVQSLDNFISSESELDAVLAMNKLGVDAYLEEKFGQKVGREDLEAYLKEPVHIDIDTNGYEEAKAFVDYANKILADAEAPQEIKSFVESKFEARKEFVRETEEKKKQYEEEIKMSATAKDVLNALDVREKFNEKVAEGIYFPIFMEKTASPNSVTGQADSRFNVYIPEINSEGVIGRKIIEIITNAYDPAEWYKNDKIFVCESGPLRTSDLEGLANFGIKAQMLTFESLCDDGYKPL